MDKIMEFFTHGWGCSPAEECLCDAALCRAALEQYEELLAYVREADQLLRDNDLWDLLDDVRPKWKYDLTGNTAIMPTYDPEDKSV